MLRTRLTRREGRHSNDLHRPSCFSQTITTAAVVCVQYASVAGAGLRQGSRLVPSRPEPPPSNHSYPNLYPHSYPDSGDDEHGCVHPFASAHHHPYTYRDVDLPAPQHSISHQHAHSDLPAHQRAIPNANGNCDANIAAYSHTVPNGNLDSLTHQRLSAYSYPHRNAHPVCGCDPNPHSHAGGEPNRPFFFNSLPHTIVNVHLGLDRDAYPHCDYNGNRHIAVSRVHVFGDTTRQPC